MRARSVTGFVRLGPVDVEVTPKFLGGDSIGSAWRVALRRALTLLGDFGFEDEWTSGLPQSHTMFSDLPGDVLARSLGEAVVRGFPLDYRELDESLRAVRGKIDVARLHESLTPPAPLCTRCSAPPRTHAAISCSWSGRCADALAAYLAERGPGAGPLFCAAGIDSRLCPDVALQPNGLKLLLRRLGARAQVPKTHAHRFRHTFATWAIAHEVRELDVQHLLGHSSPDRVRRYSATYRSAQAAERHAAFSAGDGMLTAAG